MDASERPPPSSGFRIVLTFAAFAALAGLLFLMGSQLFVRAVDGPAKLVQYFGERPPPFGLELVEAVRLPTGDVLVRLERPEAEGAGAADASGEKTPVAAAVIEYRSRSAVDPVFRIEGGGGMGGMSGDFAGGDPIAQWERDPSYDWHRTVKKDEIVWGAWRSRFLIERSFEKGGQWRDQARVDLSQGEKGRVLFVHWPAKVAADEKQLKEMLGTLVVELEPQGEGKGV